MSYEKVDLEKVGFIPSVRVGKAVQFKCGCIEIVWHKDRKDDSRIYFYPCSEKHSSSGAKTR